MIEGPDKKIVPIENAYDIRQDRVEKTLQELTEHIEYLKNLRSQVQEKQREARRSGDPARAEELSKDLTYLEEQIEKGRNFHTEGSELFWKMTKNSLDRLEQELKDHE